MQRIGIVASKIAPENLFLYNGCVLLIAFLLSVIIFLLAGSAVFLGLWLLRLLVGPYISSMSQGEWDLVFRYALVFLTVLVGCFTLAAVVKNIKLKK